MILFKTEAFSRRIFASREDAKVFWVLISITKLKKKKRYYKTEN